MALLHITHFGGLVPKAPPRRLPDNAAQVCANLLASTSEFRPLAIDLDVVANTGVNSPKTIYRLQRNADGSLNTSFGSAATWKITAADVNYARCQINSDTTERTVVSYNDGSAAPRMIDAVGGDRQLGVPKPAGAPTVTVNVIDEYTTDERTADLTSLESTVRSLVSGNLIPVWRGWTGEPASYRPGSVEPCFTDRDYIPGVDPEEAQQIRVFKMSSTGGANNGTLSNPYVGTVERVSPWFMDPALGGFWARGTSWPSFLHVWLDPAHDHWCIPVHAYGLTYDINAVPLRDALAAIPMPGKTDGTKLMTVAQADEIITLLADEWNRRWTAVGPKLNALKAKVDATKVLLRGEIQADAAAVREALAELRRLSDAVTAHYADSVTVATRIIGEYFESELEQGLPEAVVRQIETRAYIYTYVTDRGEESASSPPSELVDVDQNDTTTVVVAAPPAGRHVTHFRLYRSNSSNRGAAYQLVPNPNDDAGFPIGTLTVVDDKRSAELQEPCPSLTWDEPPADFRGVVSLGNGIHVGYSGNTILPCEPYHPYAYPPEYRKTTSHPIVGLCALDTLLVVGTRGPLKLLSGTDSASLTEIRHTSGQSVVSARSMVAMSSGVVAFASPDGVCTVDAGGQVQVVTGPDGADLFAQEDWQALNPAEIFAAEWEGSYVFHVPAGFCYCLDLRTGKLTTLNVTGSAFYRDHALHRLGHHLEGCWSREHPPHRHVAEQAGGRAVAYWLLLAAGEQRLRGACDSAAAQGRCVLAHAAGHQSKARSCACWAKQ
jgi:hypothetical protein